MGSGYSAAMCWQRSVLLTLQLVTSEERETSIKVKGWLHSYLLIV